MKPRSIDEYLATLPPEQRLALQRLRRSIRAAVPAAEECISYSIPAFRRKGRLLVWFAAATKHCSFFPGAGPIAELRDELAGYSTSKGTVRFTPDRPLPATLVRRLVRARIAEQSELAARGTTVRTASKSRTRSRKHR